MLIVLQISPITLLGCYRGLTTWYVSWLYTYTLASEFHSVVLWSVHAFVFGCLYQCSWLLGNTSLRNDLLCIEWNINPNTLTHSVQADTMVHV